MFDTQDEVLPPSGGVGSTYQAPLRQGEYVTQNRRKSIPYSPFLSIHKHPPPHMILYGICIFYNSQAIRFPKFQRGGKSTEFLLVTSRLYLKAMIPIIKLVAIHEGTIDLPKSEDTLTTRNARVWTNWKCNSWRFCRLYCLLINYGHVRWPGRNWQCLLHRCINSKDC